MLGSPPQRTALPDVIQVGNSLRLVSRDFLCREFNLTPKGCVYFLRRMGIPLLFAPGGHAFFSLLALEVVLHALLRPGSRDISLPGSDLHNKRPHAVTRIPDHMMREIQDPSSPLHAQLGLAALTYGYMDRKAVEAQLREVVRRLLCAVPTTPILKRRPKGRTAHALNPKGSGRPDRVVGATKDTPQSTSGSPQGPPVRPDVVIGVSPLQQYDLDRQAKRELEGPSRGRSQSGAGESKHGVLRPGGDGRGLSKQSVQR